MAKSISIKYHQCVLIFVTGAVCTDSAFVVCGSITGNWVADNVMPRNQPGIP